MRQVRATATVLALALLGGVAGNWAYGYVKIARDFGLSTADWLSVAIGAAVGLVLAALWASEDE
jgi:hypothetical protein